MLTDLRDVKDFATFSADVCIVGAGAAGISLAISLQNTGLNVCLLEAGGLAGDPEGQHLYSGESVGHPMTTDIGRHRGLGGTTSHWSGRCTPFSPIDFEERPWVPASGWPIGLAELEPYYQQAWSICGIRDPITPDETVLSELGVDQPLAGSDKLDLFLWRFSSRADLSRMNFGTAFTDELRNSAKIQVLLHANLHSFDATADGTTVNAVTVKSLAGTSARVQARAFVLSAGGLENARILLNSADTVPGGLGNDHGLVGRYFMQHLRCTTATITSSPAAATRLQDTFNFFPSRHGSRYEVGFVLPEATQRKEKLLNVKAILIYEGAKQSSWNAAKTLLEHLRAKQTTLQTLQAAAVVMSHPREAVVGLWRRDVLGRPALLYNGKTTVSLDLEQVPDPESRVTLTDTVDAIGLRQLRVDWRVSPLEALTARRITEAIAWEFGRCELGTVQLEPWLLDGARYQEGLVATHHHIGTTRMASDPRRGVVDADCQVFGTTNLFVAGSSVFPTGGHANPTLTIVALAIRLAGHLQQKLSSTERWHSPIRESPLGLAVGHTAAA